MAMDQTAARLVDARARIVDALACAVQRLPQGAVSSSPSIKLAIRAVVLLLVLTMLGCGGAAQDWRPVSVAASVSLTFAYETLSERSRSEQIRAARAVEGKAAKRAAVTAVRERYAELFKLYRLALRAWQQLEAARMGNASDVEIATLWAVLSEVQHELLQEIEAP